MDHSAFNAYAYVIENDNKKVIYTGDFRKHGRKTKVFNYFLHNAPKKSDCLIIEGSSFGRNDGDFLNEEEIELKMVEISKIWISKDNEEIVSLSKSQVQKLNSIINWEI